MERALAALWPFTIELFESDDVTRDAAATGYRARSGSPPSRVGRRTSTACWRRNAGGPESTWTPTGGRRGLHTEPFGYMVAEMQHLHRSFPGRDLVTAVDEIRRTRRRDPGPGDARAHHRGSRHPARRSRRRAGARRCRHHADLLRMSRRSTPSARTSSVAFETRDTPTSPCASCSRRHGRPTGCPRQAASSSASTASRRRVSTVFDRAAAESSRSNARSATRRARSEVARFGSTQCQAVRTCARVRRDVPALQGALRV